jgi:hypothetical protein
MTSQAGADVDAGGRTALARVRSRDYDRYTVEELPGRTLIVTPAVTISAFELAALPTRRCRPQSRRPAPGAVRHGSQPP